MVHIPRRSSLSWYLFVRILLSFIVQISSSENLETRRHLGSGRKTVSSQGYSELREPIKARENCYSLIWQTLTWDTPPGVGIRSTILSPSSLKQTQYLVLGNLGPKETVQ